MRIQGFVAGLVLSAAIMAMVGPAQSSASSDTNRKRAPIISERIARDIAWSLGIVRVDEIALAGGRWEIAGHDQEGNERMLDISAHDGRLLN